MVERVNQILLLLFVMKKNILQYVFTVRIFYILKCILLRSLVKKGKTLNLLNQGIFLEVKTANKSHDFIYFKTTCNKQSFFLWGLY